MLFILISIVHHWLSLRIVSWKHCLLVISDEGHEWRDVGVRPVMKKQEHRKAGLLDRDPMSGTLQRVSPFVRNLGVCLHCIVNQYPYDLCLNLFFAGSCLIVHTALLCKPHICADVPILHYVDMSQILWLLGTYPRILRTIASCGQSRAWFMVY